jgi:hypothetical protein
MKNLYFTVLFLFLVTFLIAQTKTAYISFDKTSHDFGAITQEDGLATVVFNFTNTGAEPIVISSVSTSCGCTSPDYSKEPVAPGGKGFVSAAYNPVGRPGTFNKTLTVVSNAENNNIVLTISGEVTEKVKNVEDEYPNEVGTIRLDKVLANFASIYNDEIKTETINIINKGTENVVVTVNESQLPAYIKISIEPSTIQKDQTGIITISFDGSKVDDWDYVRALFYLYLNGTINTNTKITATAIVKERFDETEKENAPKIEFESTEFDFGSLKQGESVDYTYTFKNTGKSDLIIRKTRASCGCTAINSTAEAIAPGKTGTINATFNSTGKSGTQNKIITVITNDPTQDKILLKIKGEITE